MSRLGIVLETLQTADRRLVTLMCTGMTDAEVAARVGLRVDEVASMVGSLLERSGFADRGELLAAFALGSP